MAPPRPGPGPRGMHGPKPKLQNVPSLIKRLMSLVLRRYILHCVLVAICIVGASLAQLQGTLFLQTLIDDYILPMIQSGSNDFSALAAALVRIGIIYLLGILFSYGNTRLMVNVSQGTLRILREKVFEHMQALPIRYFDTHAHGDIMSVYTNDIDTLRQFIAQSLPQLFSSIFTVISVFISMITLHVPLTLVTLVTVVMTAFATRRIAGNSGRFFAAQQKDLGALGGNIEEIMEGQKVVKVFCHEEEALAEFRELNNRLRDSSERANTYANILMPINAQLGNLGYVLCAVVGALMTLNGYAGITIGTLVSFLTLSRNFSQPISQISQQLNSIVMALAGAQRVFQLLDEPVETDDGYVTLVNAKEQNGQLIECKERTGTWAWKHPHSDGTITYTRVTGSVVMDDVDFGYIPEKMVLHNVDLAAAPGQKIAFVGSTGAGKTTITNLINRFYDIQDGKIRYDGININKIKKADLRRSLGVVLQDTNLFTGTVMDNIRYGRLDATDEECMAAARLASADAFIERLPDGYNTVLTGNGANLSQGQRQLLAIARAAVADPPVLILDEATSSIDTRTEALIQRAMDSLMHGRTTFVIAHRLSTVRNSDCIIVLEQGRIIERGTHDELIAREGRYYQLYTGNAPKTA